MISGKIKSHRDSLNQAFNQPRSCLVFLFSRALEFFSHLKFEDLTGFLKQPLYDVREMYDSPRILGLRMMQLVVCTTRFYFFCISVYSFLIAAALGARVVSFPAFPPTASTTEGRAKPWSTTTSSSCKKQNRTSTRFKQMWVEPKTPSLPHGLKWDFWGRITEVRLFRSYWWSNQWSQLVPNNRYGYDLSTDTH